MSLFILDTDTLSLHERGHPVLSPSIRALARFEQLVAMKLNIGRQDLRIAAITLEQWGHSDHAKPARLSTCP